MATICAYFDTATYDVSKFDCFETTNIPDTITVTTSKIYKPTVTTSQTNVSTVNSSQENVSNISTSE